LINEQHVGVTGVLTSKGSVISKQGREGLEEQAGGESIVGVVHVSGAPDAPFGKHQGTIISSVQEEGLYQSGAGEALGLALGEALGGGHHTPGPSSALPSASQKSLFEFSNKLHSFSQAAQQQGFKSSLIGSQGFDIHVKFTKLEVV